MFVLICLNVEKNQKTFINKLLLIREDSNVLGCKTDIQKINSFPGHKQKLIRKYNSNKTQKGPSRR